MQIKQNLFEAPEPTIVQLDPVTGGYYIVVEGVMVPCTEDGHPIKH
jgi:hypothetical protein